MFVLTLLLVQPPAEPPDVLARKMLPVYVREAGEYTIAVASAGGSCQGGPTQSGPTRTGWWNDFHRSRQSAATSSPRTPPNECQRRSSPLESV